MSAQKPWDVYAKPYGMIQGADGSKINDLSNSIIASLHQCDSPLARAFFSPTNMDLIQTNLRTVIREKTGYVISRQSDEDLALIMRAMYAVHSQHGDQDVAREVRRLNAIVLSECAPMVGTGISQHFGYLRDASTLPVPLDRAQNISIKGRNTFSLFQKI
jgi:hypothetical protein